MQSVSCNRLGEQKSPYLLQHRNNPIWWNSWAQDAIERARAENKLIFLSIGYSTCHWCHVMEKESFESDDVARMLNTNFISIKVDREEHPDVDQVYMEALQAMGSRGGWPLTMILTPDLQPLFGATYLPRANLINLLAQIQKAWSSDEHQLRQHGDRICQELVRWSQMPAEKAGVSEDLFRRVFQTELKSFDETNGGFGDAPKFPPNFQMSVLLRIFRRTGEKKAREMVEKTLEGMLKGGLYDHVAGGFCRYAVDAEWTIPHFEKMLYSQALNTENLIECYQVTKNPIYLHFIRQTLEYVETDLMSPMGGFYSAEDADSEGEEGKYYAWKYAELKEMLTPDEFNRLSGVFDIRPEGNFEHNTLHLRMKLNQESPSEWTRYLDPELATLLKKMKALRAKRVRPLRDEKILTSWNALMIHAFAKAHQLLADPVYLAMSQRAARFLIAHLYEGGLRRRFIDGQAAYEGTLEDYSYLIRALLTLYESDFDPYWLTWAKRLQAEQDQLFWDKNTGGYYYSSATTPNLILRSKEFTDNALPNPNGVAALNLLRLYHLYLDRSFFDKATQTIACAGTGLNRFPQATGSILVAIDFLLDRVLEISVSESLENPDVAKVLSQIREEFLPSLVLAAPARAYVEVAKSAGWVGASGSPTLKDGVPGILKERTPPGETPKVYICEEFICREPMLATQLSEILKEVKKTKTYTL